MAIEGVKISEFNSGESFKDPMNNATSIFLASYKTESTGNVNHQICLNDIKTYIDGKASNCWGQLSNDRKIPANADLNNYGYDKAGEWFCSGNSDDDTILNRPMTGDCGNFRLIVIVNTGTSTSSWWGTQLFIETNANHWYIRNHGNNSWGKWQKLYRQGENLDLDDCHIRSHAGTGNQFGSSGAETRLTVGGIGSYYTKYSNNPKSYYNEMVCLGPNSIKWRQTTLDKTFDNIYGSDDYTKHSFYKGQQTFNGNNMPALISEGIFLNYNGALCSEDMRTFYSSFGSYGPKSGYSTSPTYNPEPKKGRFIFGKKSKSYEDQRRYLFFSDGDDWYYIPACKCGVSFH